MKESNNKEYNDFLPEMDISDENILISEELDFGKDFFYVEKQENNTDKSSDKIKKSKDKEKKTNKGSEHAGHRKRMLERYAYNKFNGFQEHEVLEMLLYHGIPRKDTNEIAHKLIRTFGCLENVLSAEYKELVNVGLSERSALILTQYKEVDNYMRSHKSIKNVVLSTSDIAGKFCCERFGHGLVESLHLISMNIRRKVIAVNLISSGTATSTEANIASILKTALGNKAACVIICHNHPSGDTNPSSNDYLVTKRIINLLESIDILVADHIICSKDKFTSLQERGLLFN